jgi:quercetin dioxygenase-like cupin family protein
MGSNLMPISVKSRRIVAAGLNVSVREIILSPGDSIPFHYHSDVFDVFYCLQGQLSIDQTDAFSKILLSTLELTAGNSIKIESGIAHRPYNKLNTETRFLLIQGGGIYDYILYKNL